MYLPVPDCNNGAGCNTAPIPHHIAAPAAVSPAPGTPDFPHPTGFPTHHISARRQIYLKYQISHAYRLCTMRNIEPTYLEYMEHDLLPIFLYFFL